jgi:3-hydroxybutyryl-CoA dehydratase
MSRTMAAAAFDALTSGATFQSRSRTITEADIVNFAGLSGDYVELHVSEEHAARSRYGRRIAHGALIFSVSTGLSAQMDLINDIVDAFVGVDHLRFIEPVYIGDTLTVTKRVLERKDLANDRGLLVFDTKVLNQNKKIVLAYVDKLLVRRQPSRRAADSELAQRVIQSYRPDGPFMVLQANELQEIYQRYRLDPRTCRSAIFAVESLAHFLQDGVKGLFDSLNLTKDRFVLSVGEGNGAPSRLLAKLVGCRVVGVDISPLQIANAREVAALHGVEHLVEYVQQNATVLDLGERRFDAAYCNETMCHWDDKPAAISRIVKHLKPKSLLGINDWLKGRRGTLDDAHDAVPCFRDLYQPDIWRQLSLSEMCRLLEEAGLSVLRAEDLSDFVDRGLKRRLHELERLPQDTEPVRRAVQYYRVMIATHFDYLSYGRVIAQAP